MSLVSTFNDRRIQYAVTEAGESEFGFDFPIFEDSDLQVWVNDTELTANGSPGFTVPSSDLLDPDGGTLTLTGITTEVGDVVTIIGSTPEKQRTDLSKPANVTPANLDLELGRTIITQQQLRRDYGRTARLRPHVDPDVDAELPEPQANQYLGWDSEAKRLRNVTPPAFDNEQEQAVVASVEDLRAATLPDEVQRLWLSGYYGVGTAGGGPLYRDDSDTTTEDDGGTVFVDADGNRWKRPEKTDVSVSDFGAKGDGSTDDSDAFTRAINSTSPGRIRIPEGTFIVENLPYTDDVILEGDGWNSTTLQLPGSPSNPMFVAGSGTFEAGSMLHIRLLGAGKTEQHGIDVSAADQWDHAVFIGCRFDEFNRAINGSQLDRRPYFYGCKFWDNATGYHINGTHPQFTACDFRGNDNGIDGAPYDLTVSACTFVRNQYGINGTSTQGNFSGCVFFGNEKAGAKVFQRNHFSGCLIYSAVTGPELGDNEAGIIADSRLSITGGGAISDGGAAEDFTDAAIVITGGIGEVAISGVELLTSTFLRCTDGSQYPSVSVTGCSGIVRGRFVHIAGTISVGTLFCVVKGNTIKIEEDPGLTAADGIIELRNVVDSAGNIVEGNTIFDSFDTSAYGIKINGEGSIIKNNIIRRTNGIDVLSTSAETIEADNIHSPA